MKRYYSYILVFLIGALVYSMLEIIWRGYTHISMALAGGISLAFIYFIENKAKRIPLLLKCGIGAVFITVIEFCIGVVVNLCLGLNVWNYSDMFGNILGQVCPLYTLLWFVICIPAFGVCKTVDLIFNKRES